jgi:chemotaxis protein methyltransferase CheR
MTSDIDLSVIQHFILQRTGIMLTPEKRYLIETRLDPVMRQLGLPSLNAVAAKLKFGDRALETAMIDAITTNETLFFRDKIPFELFENIVMPQLIAARRSTGKIRIWCAACSSGQEPFSLAMILDEMKAKLGNITVEIVATDISERVLAQAREGLFTQFEVQRGLPVRYLLKHFTQQGTRWKLNPDIVQKVQFRSLNLLQTFRNHGPFDMIFCRNVLIYFAEATKRDILKRLSEVLVPDGYLALGGAETVLGLSQELAPHKTERSLYVPAGSANALAIGLFKPRMIA